MVLKDVFIESSVGVPLGIVGGILLLILILALCACQQLKDGTPIATQVLSEDNTQNLTIVVEEPSPAAPLGNGSIPHSTSETDASKIKVPTLQRKLPEIPVLPVPLPDEVPDATESQALDTELYATVEVATTAVLDDSLTPSVVSSEIPKSEAPPEIIPEPVIPSTSSHNIKAVSAAFASLIKQPSEPAPCSGDSDADHPYSHIQPHNYMQIKQAEHPYDWLKGQSSEERDTDTDNYDEPHVYAQSRDACMRDWLQNDAQNEPPPPPVPEKRYDVDNCVPHSSNLTAANAVSGRVSTSDIPYVTSPVESPTHQLPPPVDADPAPPLIEPQYNGSDTSASNGLDIRYTSISVREPLANLRPHSRALQPESYYSVVSDDDVDQTYAEIHGSQATTEASVYAAVEFVGSQRELPPVPPPVESLRSLRSNHSRQDSSSSNISGIVGPSDADARHSPSINVTDSASSASSVNESGDLYSTIDRRCIADRRTIHVSNLQNFMPPNNIEEMYAKVLKNKRLSLHPEFVLNEKTWPQTSSSTGAISKISINPPSSPLPQTPHSDDEFTANWTLPHVDNVRPKSMIAYSSFNDRTENSCIMSSSSAQNVSFSFPPPDQNHPGYNDVFLPEIHSEVPKSSQGENVTREIDPGYESIRDKINGYNSDPGYETVRGNNVSEPDYDMVLLTSLVNDFTDPGYETVNIHAIDQLEPGYETINMHNAEFVDPGYEEIRQQYAEDEPGYETIRQLTSKTLAEPDYERINPQQMEAHQSHYETIQYQRLEESGGKELLDNSYDPVLIHDGVTSSSIGYNKLILPINGCHNLDENVNSLVFHVNNVDVFSDAPIENVNHADGTDLTSATLVPRQTFLVAENENVTASCNFGCEEKQKTRNAMLATDNCDKEAEFQNATNVFIDVEPSYAVVNKNSVTDVENDEAVHDAISDKST